MDYGAVDSRVLCHSEGGNDGSDLSFLIQTFLNDDEDGNLHNWDSPDYPAGGGKNGDPAPGLVVHCDGGCAASGSIDRPPCGEGESRKYLGKGGVTIYHQYNPEIDIMFGTEGLVPCMLDSGTNMNPPTQEWDETPGCESLILVPGVEEELDGGTDASHGG